jgi:hypothetical protein
MTTTTLGDGRTVGFIVILILVFVIIFIIIARDKF